MDALMPDDNPFVPPERRRAQENYALGNSLARIIRCYDGVQKAMWLIKPGRQAAAGRPPARSRRRRWR